MQRKIANPLTCTIDYISKIIRAIGSQSGVVRIEYSLIKALKIEFKLADAVKLQYSFIVHLILPEQYYLKTL
jgi:hypothetical protein